jgi:hypothetical protein
LLAVRIAGAYVDVGGRVVDARTGKVVVGALVVTEEGRARTNSKGAFRITEVKRKSDVSIAAPNYRTARLEASGDPMDVKLRPIPVTGMVTSGFTEQGLRADIWGAARGTTKSDGTFAVYGAGPGETITITAFGHKKTSVKIDKTRKVDAKLELDRIDPAKVVKEVPGFGVTDAPADVVAGLNADLASITAVSGEIVGVSMKSVTKNGQGVGVVMVFAIDPAYSALPGFQDSYYADFALDANKTRKLNVAKTPVRFAQWGDLHAYTWQQLASFVLVMSDSADDAKAITEAIIGGKAGVPVESV